MLSIIIPIYNSENYIRECIDSILSQTFNDFELILVNDCSTDGTYDILCDYANYDNRIKIINNESNRGVGFCRKIGVENSSGDFILNIDSDDYLSGNTLIESVISEFNDEDVDVVVFPFRSNNFKRHYHCGIYKTMTDLKDKERILTIDSFPTIWNKIFRKKLYNIDNVFSGQKKEEPTLTYFKFLYYAKKIVCLPHKKDFGYYYYRNNNDSITNKSDEIDVAVFCTRTLFILCDFFKKENSSFFDIIFNEKHIEQHLKLFQKYEEDIKIKYPNEYIDIISMINKNIKAC